jgi:hypothetical protein
MQRSFESLSNQETCFVFSRIMMSRKNQRYLDAFRGLYPSHLTYKENSLCPVDVQENIGVTELINLYHKIKNPIKKIHIENFEIYEQIASYLHDEYFYPNFGKYLCVSKAFTSIILNIIRDSYIDKLKFEYTIHEMHFERHHTDTLYICEFKCTATKKLNSIGVEFLSSKEIPCDLSDPEKRKYFIQVIKQWEEKHKSYYNIYQIADKNGTPILQLDKWCPYYEIQE